MLKLYLVTSKIIFYSFLAFLRSGGILYSEGVKIVHFIIFNAFADVRSAVISAVRSAVKNFLKKYISSENNRRIIDYFH